MSVGKLTARNRTASTVSIRKRIIRSTSQNMRQSNKQLVKNSTVASFRPRLQRLIQQGKLDQIIYSDPHNKGDLFYRTQINQMEKQLALARKSLSTMTLKCRAKQYSINKCKHQLNKLEHQNGVIKNQSKIINKNFSQNQQKLQQIKQSLQQMTWKEKSYNQIKKRLYDDQNFLQARHEYKNKDFIKIKKQLKQLQTKYYQLSQFNKQLNKMVNQAKKISKEQVSQKNQFIDLLNDQIQQKQYIDQLKYQKKNRDKQINQLSGSQIQKQQILKYLQIHSTHKVLSQIIKIKSNNLISKYSKVQKAYMHIKSNTNIFQMDKILKRMEEQDNAYEQTLKRVSSLQIQLKNFQSEKSKQIQNRNNIYSIDRNLQQKKSIYQGMAQDKLQLLQSERQKFYNNKRKDQILNKTIVIWAQQYFLYYHIRKSETTDFLSCLKQLVNKLTNNEQAYAENKVQNKQSQKSVNQNKQKANNQQVSNKD